MNDALPGMEAAVRDIEESRRQRIQRLEDELNILLAQLPTGRARTSNRSLHKLARAIDKVLEARK